MRLCNGTFQITDEQTTFWRWSCSNGKITTLFALLQILIASASLAQHIYSIARGDGIFDCQFNATSNHSYILAIDIVVFDYGLFHQLLGTDKCVANHLDGGYMRFVWCIVQLISLLLLLQAIHIPKLANPALLRPAVFVQSIYSLGLIILALATLPKMMSAMINRFREIANNTFIYAAGTLFNWAFTVTLWHFYWHMKARTKNPRIRYTQGNG